MTRSVPARALHVVFAAATLFAITAAQAASRREIGAAYAACKAIGRDYAKLARELAPDRAILSPVRNGRALIGYPRAFWGPSWVCRVDVDERGIIRRVQRLDRDAPREGRRAAPAARTDGGR
jgi:hypothetical protein